MDQTSNVKPVKPDEKTVSPEELEAILLQTVNVDPNLTIVSNDHGLDMINDFLKTIHNDPAITMTTADHSIDFLQWLEDNENRKGKTMKQATKVS